ncbi:MAG: FkbM family methyltransferase [Limisphaerales bacterium]
MTWRQIAKRWLYRSAPGFSGAFPYFGAKVFFPPDSMIFRRACAEGIYEAKLLHMLLTLIRPGTTYLDIGANIGLMSVPVLAEIPDARVLSFEPSPANLPYLLRTFESSAFQSRWRIITKAVSDHCGESEFYTSSANGGAMDGFRDTGRGVSPKKLSVSSTTVDQVWGEHGRPRISCMKIDVEGGELGVLRGAERCLEAESPSVLLEWNATNLAAYHCDPEALLAFARAHDQDLVSCVHFTVISSGSMLRLAMRTCENFLLLPR